MSPDCDSHPSRMERGLPASSVTVMGLLERVGYEVLLVPRGAQ